jgi:putative tricarboxylic transport membrane protein
LLTRIKRALADTEIVMLLVMFVFVVAFIIDVRDNPRAGRLFPSYLGLVTLILLSIESVITFRKRKRASLEAAPRPAEPVKEADRRGPANIVVKFVLLIFLYYLAILAIGYLYASFLFLVVTMWMLGIRKKMVILAITVGTLAAIYIVFVWGFTFLLPGGQLF